MKRIYTTPEIQAYALTTQPLLQSVSTERISVQSTSTESITGEDKDGYYGGAWVRRRVDAWDE